MNSNHSIYTAPLLRRLCRSALLATALLLTGGLTACHQSIAPTEEELAGSCEQAVRITARVSPFGGAPAGTRADVPGKVDNKQTGDWQPLEKEIAVKGESRISRLYVFVTKRGSDKIEKTLYYYAADYKADGNGGEEVENGLLKGTEIPAMELTTTAGEVTMDMKLLPGDYSFLLVANSHKLAQTIKSEQPRTLSALTDIVVTSGIGFASIAMDEGFTDFDYDFSIIGYGDLTVPATTDSDDPVELRPVILMERHYARVDVSLTTATDSQLTDYLSVYGNGDRFDPSQYRLTQFLFLVTVGENTSQNAYPVRLLPVEGEYTVLPEGVPRYPLESYKAPVIGNGDGLSGRRLTRQFLYYDLVFSDSSSGSDLWGKYINNGKTGGLGMLWKQPLVFSRGTYKSPNEPGPGYIYLPAVYFGDVTDKDKDKDKVVRLQLKFTKLDDSETLTYRIPIHNETGASDYYSIRRNTIYDIDLTFYGDELQVQQSGVLVYPWKRVDQTFEVNPDDEGVDPLWKQDKP